MRSIRIGIGDCLFLLCLVAFALESWRIIPRTFFLASVAGFAILHCVNRIFLGRELHRRGISRPGRRVYWLVFLLPISGMLVLFKNYEQFELVALALAWSFMIVNNALLPNSTV